MTGEVIDLTGSPPPPSVRRYESLRIRRLRASALVSARRTQVARPAPACCALPLWPNQRIAPWIPRFPQATIHEVPRIIGLQPTMTAVANQPLALYQSFITPQPNTFIINPQPTNSYEPWTPQEHGIFLMGLIKYGRGRWRKIARDFGGNKTIEQVQIHANYFYRHLQTTYVCNYKRRTSCPTCKRTIFADLSRNENLQVARSAPAPASLFKPVTVTENPLPTLYSHPSSFKPMAVTEEPSLTLGFASSSFNPMARRHEEPPPTLNLFPVEAPFFPVSSNGGHRSTISRTPTRANNNGYVDLELRLG